MTIGTFKQRIFLLQHDKGYALWILAKYKNTFLLRTLKNTMRQQIRHSSIATSLVEWQSRMLNGRLYLCLRWPFSVQNSVNTRGNSRKINSVGPIHDYTCITMVHNTFRFQIFIFYCLFAFCDFYLDFLTFFPKYNNPKPFHDTLLTMLMLTTFLHHRVKYVMTNSITGVLVSIFTNT